MFWWVHKFLNYIYYKQIYMFILFIFYWIFNVKIKLKLCHKLIFLGHNFTDITLSLTHNLMILLRMGVLESLEWPSCQIWVITHVWSICKAWTSVELKSATWRHVNRSIRLAKCECATLSRVVCSIGLTIVTPLWVKHTTKRLIMHRPLRLVMHALPLARQDQCSDAVVTRSVKMLSPISLASHWTRILSTFSFNQWVNQWK